MDIYVLPYQDKYIVYRPLKRLAFIANAALVNLILTLRSHPEEAMTCDDDETEAQQFLRSMGFWEPVQPPQSRVSPEVFTPTVAVLFLTTACNFRCIYCYASGGEQGAQTLPEALGRRAIDRVCANAETLGHACFDLAFHGGGEPTLAMAQMRNLIPYARSRSLPCHVTLTSNGYWSDADQEWLMQHLDSVSLSFDGIRPVQDRQRPLASGQGTFDRLMRTISALDRRECPYGIRMTVTDDSIEALVPSVQMLCQETGCQTIQVEPAFDHGRASQTGSALQQHTRFAQAFLEAYDLASADGRHLYYSGARPWVITDRFCQAPNQALVVTPDGTLTMCYEICDQHHPGFRAFIAGKLTENGDLHLDLTARQRFFQKLDARRHECEDCFCYWHCAGDCPAKTLSSQENGHLTFGARCDLNRLITKELLIRYIARGNGLWQGTLADIAAT